MRVHHACAQQAVTFTVECDPDELPATYQTARNFATLTPHPQTGEVTFRFLLPDVLGRFEAVHPDLWGLVVLLAVYPFVDCELRLSWSVSQTLADAYQTATGGKTLMPVDASLESRAGGDVEPSGAPRHASVAYGGRLHAYLTAAVMGQDARLVALDHWNARAGVRTAPYPADGLYYALDVMESKHYHVSMVKTDLESLYKPYGFAHPLTAACGNVLLADALQLHTLAVGSRLHDVRAFQQPHQPLTAIGFKRVDVSVALDGHEADPTGSVQGWRALFGACGLALEFPTCGAHDSLLVRLMHEHRLWHEAHYCLYARSACRCETCIECLYYTELHKAVTQAPTTFDALWNRCTHHFPETVACVQDVGTPHRWHMFWAAMVRRRETLPKGKAFDALYAMHQTQTTHATDLHAGMQALTGEAVWPRVEQGLRRLLGVLYVRRGGGLGGAEKRDRYGGGRAIGGGR